MLVRPSFVGRRVPARCSSFYAHLGCRASLVDPDRWPVAPGRMDIARVTASATGVGVGGAVAGNKRVELSTIAMRCYAGRRILSAWHDRKVRPSRHQARGWVNSRGGWTVLLGILPFVISSLHREGLA